MKPKHNKSNRIEGQLQTRKWQDQSGQDKYSTEVVLQGFGGTLTMLDGPGGDKREESGGYDSGPASPAPNRDLDSDNIPF